MKCYKLNHNFNDIGDSEKDAFIYEYKGFDSISSKMLRKEKLSLPKPMFFSADFKDSVFTDYPITDIHYPIMSKRMLEAIDSDIKNHLIELYPCTMIDDTFLGNPFKQEGLLKDEVVIRNDYFLVQLKIIDKIFNLDESIYEESLIFPGKIGTIKKLVLKEPEDGFPPIFRIPQYPGIFIPEKTKNNLEKNNITGCLFEVIEVSNNSNISNKNKNEEGTSNINWPDLRSTLDKIQIASLNSTGEKELKELLNTIKSSGSITINKQGKNIVITNNDELQNLINTYDPNIKLTDIS